MRYNIEIQQPKPKPKKVGMIKKQPKLGDTKEKIRFAYLPTDINQTTSFFKILTYKSICIFI